MSAQQPSGTAQKPEGVRTHPNPSLPSLSEVQQRIASLRVRLAQQTQHEDRYQADSSLKHMLTLAKHHGGAGKEAQLDALKQRIEALPKPARGDRKAARPYNTQGLEAVNRQAYTQAVQAFSQAYHRDPGNVEIVNNLGFAYLKAGNLPEATRYLGIALSIAPSRAAAWANMAELFARSERLEEAVAAYALTWHFSKNRDTTQRTLEQLATTAEYSQVMQAAKQALTLLLNL